MTNIAHCSDFLAEWLAPDYAAAAASLHCNKLCETDSDQKTLRWAITLGDEPSDANITWIIKLVMRNGRKFNPA